MITKNELVVDAFEQLRISGLTVSPSPSEITSAVRRMDSMVLSWQNQGLCLGYNNSEGYSKTDPLQESGIADSDALAVVLNLAKTLAASYGQQMDRLTLGEAKTAFESLFSVELTMREPDTFQPTGAGNSAPLCDPRPASRRCARVSCRTRCSSSCRPAPGRSD